MFDLAGRMDVAAITAEPRLCVGGRVHGAAYSRSDMLGPRACQRRNPGAVSRSAIGSIAVRCQLPLLLPLPLPLPF